MESLYPILELPAFAADIRIQKHFLDVDDKNRDNNHAASRKLRIGSTALFYHTRVDDNGGSRSFATLGTIIDISSNRRNSFLSLNMKKLCRTILCVHQYLILL